MGAGKLEVALPSGDATQSLHAAESLAAASAQAWDHLWLAIVAEIQGRRGAAGAPASAQSRLAQAEASLRKAAELGPDNPAVWMAVCRFHARSGRAGEAQRNLLTAQSKVPPASLPCLLAQGWESLGNVEKATSSWEDVLRSCPDAGPRDRAAIFLVRTGKIDRLREYLETVSSGKAKVAGGDDAWARRTLAVLLARGSAADRLRAQRLIDQNLERAPDSPQDRQIKAALLKQNADPDSQRQAIRILEGSLSADSSADPAQRLDLAQYCITTGDYPRARSIYGSCWRISPTIPAIGPNSFSCCSTRKTMCRPRRNCTAWKPWPRAIF